MWAGGGPVTDPHNKYFTFVFIVAEDPLTCVARGTSIYLESLEDWKATLESDLDEV